jgi:hypothetical protein
MSPNFFFKFIRYTFEYVLHELHTGCLIKKTPQPITFYLLSDFNEQKKNKDMVFHALQNSHKIFVVWRYLQ